MKQRKKELESNKKKLNTKLRSYKTDSERDKELREKEIEVVLFVPYTPDSELCNLLQEVKEKIPSLGPESTPRGILDICQGDIAQWRCTLSPP